MNTFRDPATNVSIHIPTESDDPNWTRAAPGEERDQVRRRSNSLATGNSTKYSPISQQRARGAGFAIPEGVPEYAQKVTAWGQIHPRE
jgi:hypothetical protein